MFSRFHTQMNTQLSWAERLALKVERKFPLGRLGWLVVYGIALLALLPTLMSLGLGTGLVICAYATEGLYRSEEHTSELQSPS